MTCRFCLLAGEESPYVRDFRSAAVHHGKHSDWLPPGHGRAVSLEYPVEIKTEMAFARETHCPASDGFSAARTEEETVVTDKGREVISLFPAEELPIAGKVRLEPRHA